MTDTAPRRRAVPLYDPDREELFELTVPDVAKILGKHQATIRAWVKRGYLTHNREPGGRVMFRRSDIRRIAGLERPTPALTRVEDE